ncbi:hypothetical protein GZH46_01176, partial [Fragariocoptes setiger]
EDAPSNHLSDCAEWFNLSVEFETLLAKVTSSSRLEPARRHQPVPLIQTFKRPRKEAKKAECDALNQAVAQARSLDERVNEALQAKDIDGASEALEGLIDLVDMSAIKGIQVLDEYRDKILNDLAPRLDDLIEQSQPVVVEQPTTAPPQLPVPQLPLSQLQAPVQSVVQAQAQVQPQPQPPQQILSEPQLQLQLQSQPHLQPTVQQQKPASAVAEAETKAMAIAETNDNDELLDNSVQFKDELQMLAFVIQGLIDNEEGNQQADIENLAELTQHLQDSLAGKPEASVHVAVSPSTARYRYLSSLLAAANEVLNNWKLRQQTMINLNSDQQPQSSLASLLPVGGPQHRQLSQAVNPQSPSAPPFDTHNQLNASPFASGEQWAQQAGNDERQRLAQQSMVDNDGAWSRGENDQHYNERGHNHILGDKVGGQFERLSKRFNDADEDRQANSMRQPLIEELEGDHYLQRPLNNENNNHMIDKEQYSTPIVTHNGIEQVAEQQLPRSIGNVPSGLLSHKNFLPQLLGMNGNNNNYNINRHRGPSIAMSGNGELELINDTKVRSNASRRRKNQRGNHRMTASRGPRGVLPRAASGLNRRALGRRTRDGRTRANQVLYRARARGVRVQPHGVYAATRRGRRAKSRPLRAQQYYYDVDERDRRRNIDDVDYYDDDEYAYDEYVDDEHDDLIVDNDDDDDDDDNDDDDDDDDDTDDGADDAMHVWKNREHEQASVDKRTKQTIKLRNLDPKSGGGAVIHIGSF